MMKTVLFVGLLCLVTSLAFSDRTMLSCTSLYAWNTSLDTLKQDTLRIDTVFINREIASPLEKFEKKKEDYKQIYFWGDNKNMVTVPITGGIMININKLYNHLSRRGKASRRMQRVFEREYEDDLVNEIWRPLVKEYSKLQGDTLEKFMIYYKPSLVFLSDATPYERVAYLTQSLKNYKDSVSIILERLKLPEMP